MRSDRHASARRVVTEALFSAAGHFPRLGPTSLDTHNLGPRDARLALAIHRAVLQRWMTIEHLLDQHLSRPMAELEPALRALLLTAGAQLLFFDRLPHHAVVDESVSLAGKLVRRGAGGLVNAVLRRLSETVGRRLPDQPWTPAADRLPLDRGHLLLQGNCLPDPDVSLTEHLAAATSHPRYLVQRWLQDLGTESTLAICQHDGRTPPTIVAVEAPITAESCSPHVQDGFVLWQTDHHQLVAYLEADWRRRVQDPASAQAVEATRGLELKLVVDFCAGRGTKTRQLAMLHPQARILATDTQPDRFAELHRTFAHHQGIAVVPIRKLQQAVEPDGADLVLADVPCSNTAVLARRPEARYRFDPRSLASLLQLQRKILDQAAPLIRPGGCLLYSTCSLERSENQEQVRAFMARANACLLGESLTLPAGESHCYHDGNYHALLRMPER